MRLSVFKFLLVNTMNCSGCLLTLLMEEAQEMLHTECSIFYFLNGKAIQSKLVVPQSRPHEYLSIPRLFLIA